jgi:hypothetical protein
MLVQRCLRGRGHWLRLKGKRANLCVRPCFILWYGAGSAPIRKFLRPSLRSSDHVQYIHEPTAPFSFISNLYAIERSMLPRMYSSSVISSAAAVLRRLNVWHAFFDLPTTVT